MQLSQQTAHIESEGKFTETSHYSKDYVAKEIYDT
jgi:hypothetical protein